MMPRVYKIDNLFASCSHGSVRVRTDHGCYKRGVPINSTGIVRAKLGLRFAVVEFSAIALLSSFNKFGCYLGNPCHSLPAESQEFGKPNGPETKEQQGFKNVGGF